MTNAKGPKADSTDDELWDANDAARYLKVSRSWIYQRADAGLLPSLRIGGLLRFDPAGVRAFARGETHAPKPLPFPPSQSGKKG